MLDKSLRLVTHFSPIEYLKALGFTAIDVPISGTRKLFTTIDIEDGATVLLCDRIQAVSHRAKERLVHYAYINVRCKDGKWRPHYLHRLFLGLEMSDPRLGDHADRNGLNNRRSNLRIASDQQNTSNKSPIKTRLGLPKGVRLDRRQQRKGFSAQINVHNKVIYLGYFGSAEEAADAYDRAAMKYHGEFAVTNKMLRELADGAGGMCQNS